MRYKLEEALLTLKLSGGASKTVSNPFINIAMHFADLMLHEANETNFSKLGAAEINIEDGWQLLFVSGESVGYDAFIKALEAIVAAEYNK